MSAAALLAPAVARSVRRQRSLRVRLSIAAARTLARPVAVQVTVVDGDTNRRVSGARVTIGARTARSNRHGVARVPLAHRAPLVTSAAKLGYGERAVRLSFRTHPKSTIRIYRRSRSGRCTAQVRAARSRNPCIRVRPPFRVVWSRGLGTLIEFPAVVSDGVAYIANARGTVRALDMRDGTVIWRHDTPRGKMAASPAVWRDQLIVHGMDGHVWVLRRSDGKLLWHYTVGSPVESSPVVVDDVDVFGAWNGTITALDLRTHRVRWRRYDGCKVTSSAALAGRTLYIGDYCGRLLALSARTGATPLVAQRQRPCLRHTGGRRRPRLRAQLDRRLADGLLDERTLPLAPHHRLLRLLVAGRVAGTCLLRLVQRRASTHSGPPTARRSGRATRAARSPAPQSSSTASPTPARSRTGSSASTCAAGASCSTSRTASTCPVSGGGAPAAAARLLAAVRGGGAVKRVLIAARAARAARRGRRRCRLLPARAARVARRAGLVDDRVRDDRRCCDAARGRRNRASRGRRTARTPSGSGSPTACTLAPPFTRVWTFRAQALVEFPPAVAYGRLFFANNAGVLFAIGAKNGKRGVEVRLPPLRRGFAGRRPSRRLRDVHERAAVQPQAESHS